MTHIEDGFNDTGGCKIIPNPSNGLFRISGVEEGSLTVTLFNEMGQQVWYQKTVACDEIINTHLPPGSYLCVVQRKNHHFVLPLLIQ
jgi:hypothetical protein